MHLRRPVRQGKVMSFEDLGLAPSILSALQTAGFTEPTPVQAAAIPRALAGADLMVSSQTGSGKTAAFMLPALNRVADMSPNKGVGVQILVLTPTRELALQVADATAAYGANLPGLRATTVVGGVPYGAQLKALSRRVDVLVATPGRLIDHLKAGRVKLNTVHTLVLDEADRMLDMSFIEDIETIIERLPESRQTLLFSATLDGSVARLAEKMMRSPERIEISGHRDKHANITQSLLYADDSSHKLRLLDHLLRDTRLDQAIVFTSTKRGADELADRLAEQGFAAAALHGDMNQRQRTRTLTQLQRGQVRVLVATDVAARGIDVQGISHAVNFDLPLQAEDYVHRIGRTGRAGRDGLAYTLAVHSERHKVRRIEHYIGQTIAPETIAGLEPQRTARPSSGGPRFGGNKRPGERRFGDRPQGDRPQGDRPQRDFGDRPQRSFGDRPQRDFGDRPQRSFGDHPQRDFGDRPQRSFGDRPQRDFGDRPQRSFGDRPQRDAGDRPQRSFGDRPQRDFGDRPQRSFGDRPQRDAGDRPQRSFDNKGAAAGKRFSKPAGDRRG
ncbi:DEAD/DEAH box helicase [Bordetella holmesii]|uniref:DEAD/DEAH box helicase n=1 Tax=Bordetella holmesii TaxID=35814 RepID=UPI00129871BF|nr:DEAD/DEAH box helicase [Bordetella holmesii]QGE30689.1 DEAD/DEAH box helicase [Bordetella holmesii]QGE41349.1 DEAD/DEAH box helicase [Bordetella holmesii]QGE44598.1 DEAD/DEAH box helicase [Bordetella holmesii]QGE47841.1 DEAD/DEAH box helicase [Bordetella holmesii]